MLDLVTKRFLATFAHAATRTKQRLTIKVAKEHIFYVYGSRITNHGWIRYYLPYFMLTEMPLPSVKVGEQVKIKKILVQEHFTAPLPRYNPASLLQEMEDCQIGTKATRASIIDILYRRNYVCGETMRPTRIADAIMRVLKRECPRIVDVSFTSDLEEQLNRIELGKVECKDVVTEAMDQLGPLIGRLKVREDEIGKELDAAIREVRLQEITLKVSCPSCGLPLRIVRSKRTKKRFIGCSGLWTNGCRFSLPLPQFGTLKLVARFCQKCGFQLVKVRAGKRKPLISCPRCYVSSASSQLQ
jgi:DNA topoisomerase-1